MDLVEYYAARAREYDEIYRKPERQEDLGRLRELVREELRGLEVLEVACGTGYWTEVLAEAGSVVAADVNEAVIEIARGRSLAEGRVQFLIGDAYRLPVRAGRFSGGLAAFWWSHVPKTRLEEFLGGFFDKLRTGAKFILMDNNYVEGSSTRIDRRDREGNTYQKRRLKDGTETEVLKNFPAAAELELELRPFEAEVRVEWLRHYWCAIGRARAV